MLNERKQTSLTRQNITAKESPEKAVQAVMQGRELGSLLLLETHLIILIKDNYTFYLYLYILFFASYLVQGATLVRSISAFGCLLLHNFFIVVINLIQCLFEI